jgi:hypothetical protein
MPESADFYLLLSAEFRASRSRVDYICSRSSSFASDKDHQASAGDEEASIWTINDSTRRLNAIKCDSGVGRR